MLRFDVVILSDFRFAGGTSTAIAEEIRAAKGAGYSVGLVPLEAANLTTPLPLHPRLRALIEAEVCSIVPPGARVEARLAQLHNPYAGALVPWEGLRLRAEQRMLVVHHPPFAADGTPYYDLATVRRNAAEILNGRTVWAPVGPAVRRQLAGLADGPPLAEHDWHNVVELGRWSTVREPPPGDRPTVIGRHSRPDPRKWPATRDEILRVYPPHPRLRVRILGGGRFLQDLVGLYPANWDVLRFGAEPPEQFLRSLDLFLYHHHPNWVEAFGCTIAEAMASGLPTLLPPSFEPLFGDGAVYSAPEAAAETALRLMADPDRYRERSAAARAYAERHFSHRTHQRRLRELIGPPSIPAPPRTQHQPRRVLLVSSNGVGMGHLTRLLAIARRLPEGIEPVFVTMSQAMRVVHEFGYLAEYIPYHQYLDCDVARWNKHLARELAELMGFYGARVLVFDSNCPFQGVIDTADACRHAWFVWCRRGMWQAGAGAKFLAREKHFDAVIEPRDLADAFDAGLTPGYRERARLVGPIRLLDEHEWLPRDLARAELGLDPERPAVLVQLGSGNNFEYGVLRRLLLDQLLARPGLQVVLAEWLMADRALETTPGITLLRHYPLSRYIRAFDASVSAPGYNTFHEVIAAGLPSIFVPNENPQQDDQLARARFAERRGLGWCVRVSEHYRLVEVLDRLLDPEEQARVRATAPAFRKENGAVEAAHLIAELAYIRRGMRGPGAAATVQA